MKETKPLTEADLALCRSALYEALALGFRPPNQETANRLLTDKHNQALTEIAAMVDEGSKGKRSKSLATCVQKLMESSDLQGLESLQSSFRYFFGHTAHSKVPLYETEYGTETLFQQPQQLSDISGFFSAFGLTMNLREHERVDHISCECEFLSFLTRKETYALQKDDSNMLEETRKAQKLFLKDHLGKFTPSFANLLTRADRTSFYAALGKLGHQFILLECNRFGVPAGPENLRLRPKVVVDDCLTCGSGESLIKEIAG